MNLNIIQKKDEVAALEKLKVFYDKNLIPAEKKAYLTSLRHSVGPYMAVEAHAGGQSYMQDAASQIATLGLGFNPTAYFGVGQYLESWTNTIYSPKSKAMKKSMDTLLKRELGWKRLYSRICHSGAEANEFALGQCYRNRKNPAAKKVLAFEGSFHGRMLTTLSATWNKAKREPFEWQGHEAIFCPAPELPDDQFNRVAPKGWQQFWDFSTIKHFSFPQEWSALSKNDKTLENDIHCLQKVREELGMGHVYAVVIEPMQCEGGDRYMSNRFLTALLLMSRSYGIPVIFDEVQTGFHLGRKFFWHMQMDLQCAQGKRLQPDYVICAKKAQVGMVLARKLMKVPAEEFQVASLARGLIQAQILAQSDDRILALEETVKPLLQKLVDSWKQHIERPRLNGMAFAFDLKDESVFNTCIEYRFPHGLLYYNAGTRTLRFRLNLAYDKEDLNFLFQELDQIFSELFNQTKTKLPKQIEKNLGMVNEMYAWNEFLISTKLEMLQNLLPGTGESIEQAQLKQWKDDKWDEARQLLGFAPSAGQKNSKDSYQLLEITNKNFSQYSGQISQLEKLVYEPVRQTPIEMFETAVKDKSSVCLGVLSQNQLVAISFSAPLINFPSEKGVRRDPDFNNPDAFYMLDTTVASQHQSHGLGKKLKYLVGLKAMLQGAQQLNGRNRCLLAAGMWNINLAMGAHEIDYIREDYPDNEKSRDVIYYSTPLRWNPPALELSNGAYSPLGPTLLTSEFIKQNLPVIVNKICLSNFVDQDFLNNLDYLFSLLPEQLRHGYSTSGQSECADKIAKSLWYNSKRSSKQITFKGHYFGGGSNFAQALSQIGTGLFPVEVLEHPTEDNWEKVLEELKSKLSQEDYLGVWIEPVRQLWMDHVPMAFLTELNKICKVHKTPLVYNETASGFYAMSPEHFFISSNPEMSPDAFMCYGGGQIGIVATTSDHFVAKPLMMISTWDGDQYSLSAFTQAVKQVALKREEYLEVCRVFDQVVEGIVKAHPTTTFSLERARGYFIGKLPYSMRGLFRIVNGRYLIWPNFDSIRLFLEQADSFEPMQFLTTQD